MQGRRFFASKAQALTFAKTHPRAVVTPLRRENPLHDLGYRWQVEYEIPGAGS